MTAHDDLLTAVKATGNTTLINAATAAKAEYDALLARTTTAIQPEFKDRPGWKLVFSDDFPTPVALGQFPAAVSAKWGAYPSPWKDTSKNGTYDPAKTAKIENGVLKITMFTDSDGVIRVCAPTPKLRGQLYGRYAIRARFPNLMPGYKVAWLLWPDSGTNTTGSPDGVGGNGEIDFPEFNLDRSDHVGAYMHRQNATVNNDQAAFSASVDVRQWHEYVIEWREAMCRFLIDGREIGKATDRVPRTSMHYVIQSETILDKAHPPAPTVKGTIEIDRVAIWAAV